MPINTIKALAIFSATLFITTHTWAADRTDKTLTFEPTPYQNTKLHCENDNDIFPANNDFDLLNYSIMSSEEGERFAFITLHNTSSGQRIFTQDQLIAILGDCSRKQPLAIEKKFAGDEIISLQVNLGLSRFPVLKLITQRE